MKHSSSRILILDDDPAILRLAQELIQQSTLTCQFHTADSPEAFRTLWASQAFDLVLADCRTAHADGWRTLDLVRKSAEKTPYIILSDSMHEEFAIDGLQRGAWDYLLKSNLRNLPCVILRARDYFREKDLQKAEDKSRWYAQLLDLSNDAIFVRDAFDMILYWNQGAERLYGWTAAEAIGKRSRHLLRSCSPNREWSAISDECSGAGRWEGDLVRHHRNGQRISVTSRWILHPHPNPSHTEIVEIDADQSGIKQMEEQFHRAQRMQVLGRLAGGLAHNFNNVLTVFQSALGILKLKGRHSEDMATLHEILESSVENGVTLVKQIAMMANQGTGGISDVNLNSQLTDVMSIMQQTFPKSIVLDFQPADHMPAIRGDAAKINQALLNVCLNARDAIPTRGKITLSVRSLQPWQLPAEVSGAKTKEYVCVTVEDTGRGGEPGLESVQGIVREQDGLVSVQANPGQGTRVSLYFPAAASMPRMTNAAGRMTSLPCSRN